MRQIVHLKGVAEITVLERMLSSCQLCRYADVVQLHVTLILNNSLSWTVSMITSYIITPCRSQWPRSLRCRSTAARLLRSWVRIPPGSWMFVCCECCVLSGKCLCDELTTRLEESYRLRCVVVCDRNQKNPRE